MRFGVNLTGPSNLASVKALIKSCDIDFVEIMIDNFVCVPAKEFEELLNGMPCSFHIMNSQFITRNINELKELSSIILEFSSVLNPLYISDHMAIFLEQNQLLSLPNEPNYEKDYDVIKDRVDFWQSKLGNKIFFENIPGMTPQIDTTVTQAQFFQSLIRDTGCGLLFDCSNATIGHINAIESFDSWFPLISASTHWHVAGSQFFTGGGDLRLLVDTHNTEPLPETISFFKTCSIFKQKTKSKFNYCCRAGCKYFGCGLAA